MGKVLAAIAAMMACVSATPMAPLPNYSHEERAIVQVFCKRADGNTASGTAFKVGRNSYITANHVTASGLCYVGGERITVTSSDFEKDYATFQGPASDVVLKADCKGFRAGEVYIARGYPGGMPFNIQAPWTAMDYVMDGFQVFTGEGIPGMSGGAVIDRRGVAVGLVNKRWPTRSMPLRSTSFCRG